MSCGQVAGYACARIRVGEWRKISAKALRATRATHGIEVLISVMGC